MINIKELSHDTAVNYNKFLDNSREELLVEMMNCASRGVDFLYIRGDANIELSKAIEYLCDELYDSGFFINNFPNKQVPNLSDWWIRWPREEMDKQDLNNLNDLNYSDF